ncbi:MAG: DEAD/DEAH box helicase family protein [Gemmatimonadota bacterium]|nr:DEAD/DEAH box helicase family protein [Gemmatimonadota bacterium]
MPSVQNTELDQRLVLLAWINQQFGYEQNRDLLRDMKLAAEGFDPDGRSHVYHRLISRGDAVNVEPDTLLQYNENIRNHLNAMNARRSNPITLRYFQYLAALYAEVFLDGYFNGRGKMLRSLNAFSAQRNRGEEFCESDLKKLAFWMATGSGKTLIMHLNYRQFLYYNDESLDNILLITPNEGLSDQHLAEMAASAIRCQQFNLNVSGEITDTDDLVQVIEITKLVEQKRGGGISVPVEAFEGNNLVFVDEGHKGSGGEAWRRYRDALGESGFTFEYSATFGQALKAAANDELTVEYGKAIAFDYSYRYFHGDGYGKDFRVLNLVKKTSEEATETLLLGNLLSFYEQQCVFTEHAESFRPYHLERPLWVFVGSTVNAVYTENKEKCSDVLTVARFLHRVLSQPGWTTNAIDRLIKGESGLITPYERDVFANKFTYLRAIGRPSRVIYQDILKNVFQVPTSGGLHLCTIRGADGELGLRVSGAQDYFGLIYIGDVSSFKNLVEEADTGITLEDDALSGSLFERINEPNSGIEVLIGAKKFMEGWNSWRVSNMGLLNIGRREGAEIIQLFGRGVRLRGKNASLKRSATLDGVHPEYIGLLETLNIFAVRANYMSDFKEYLEREGLDADGYDELPLFVRPDMKLLEAGLVVPRIEKGTEFAHTESLLLEPDRKMKSVRVDLSLKVQAMESSEAGVVTTDAHSGTEERLSKRMLDLVDWEQAYLDLIEYKEEKEWGNLCVLPDGPRRILEDSDRYNLIVDEPFFPPKTVGDIDRLQDAATRILKKYTDVFYRVHRERWESKEIVYKTLDERDPNLSFGRESEGRGRYVVSVRRSKIALMENIEKLIKDCEQLYEMETYELPRLHFDRHLYQPLLVEYGDEDDIRTSPPGLNNSERQFVQDLRNYWVQEKDGKLSGLEVFLLRNQSRGVGVGFFEASGFYPDFILWIKNGNTQHVVFVEPHGMRHASAHRHDEKVGLHEKLRELAPEIGKRSNRNDVTLDSYIVSATPFDDLSKVYDDGSWDRERFAKAHILFQEGKNRYDYIERIIENQLT